MATISRSARNNQVLVGPWYLAKLKPAAFTLFPDSFYPKPNRLGAVYVYVNADAPVNGKSAKVKILNGKSGIRVLASTSASKCLEVVRKVTVAEQTMIDKNIEDLSIKL